MLFPWGSDAPLYHRPIATIALIVINVALFFLVPHSAFEHYALMLGHEVHPLQWLTNNFLHTGIFHLAGNMLFLWTFGLIVEGKLGWWRFLALYLALGVFDSGAMQMIVSSQEEAKVLGSSTIIFGLLGICLVWAPRNEVSCIVWIRFTPMELDLSILWFGVLYIALDVFSGGLSGVLRASVTNQSKGLIVAVELNHTFGAILGMLVGGLMLRLGWVDCEYWDLFAVLEGRAGKPRDRKTRKRKSRRRDFSEFGEPKKPRSKKKKAGAEVRSIEDPAAALLRTFRGHIACGEIEAALAVYQKARRSPSGWDPPERDRRDLIEALLEQQLWDDAVLLMRDYLRDLPDPSPRVRLKLAQILIQKQGRPQQALRVLAEIPEGSLPANLKTLRMQLTRNAEARLEDEDAPLELEEDLG